MPSRTEPPIPERFDCTDKIGPMYPEAQGTEWPMYSFATPSTILWGEIAARLRSAGWSESRIREWLQSKGPRYLLDGAMGDALRDLGEQWAARIAGGEG